MSSLPNPSHLQDIRGSQAYARALSKVGIITKAECEAIVDGLNQARVLPYSRPLRSLPASRRACALQPSLGPAAALPLL